MRETAILIQKKKAISLGHRCEVAWQIRSFFIQPEAYPFDWLVTPMQSLLLMIAEDFEQIANHNLLEVIQYNSGWTVINSLYNCFLHHDFKRDSTGEIAEDWKEHISEVKEKYDYIRLRWKQLSQYKGDLYFYRRLGNMEMPNEKVLYTDSEEYIALYDMLKKSFPSANLKLIFIDCENVPASSSILSSIIGYANASDWPDQADLWKGKTIEYIKCFESTSK